MGCNSLINNIVLNAATNLNSKTRIAYYTLENSINSVITKLMSLDLEVEIVKLQKGLILNTEYNFIIKNKVNLENSQIYFEDQLILIDDIYENIKKLVSEKKVEFIVIDEYQKIKIPSSKNLSKSAKTKLICKRLQEIAKEFNVCILSKTQMSRSPEKREGNYRPNFSDLKYINKIAPYTNLILLLYRPEYYYITEDENGMPTKGLIEIQTVQNKGGSTGLVKLKFDSRFLKYSNISDKDRKNSQHYPGNHSDDDSDLPF